MATSVTFQMVLGISKMAGWLRGYVGASRPEITNDEEARSVLLAYLEENGVPPEISNPFITKIWGTSPGGSVTYITLTGSGDSFNAACAALSNFSN